MTQIDIPLHLKKFHKNSTEATILAEAESCRRTAESLISEERYIDALERTVEALRTLREFPDFDNTEFRAMLLALLFDLAEIHFALKDYRQSEKELEVIFKVLDNLIRDDAERFGHYHILAMELSTRILRSRKKTMELLVKHQIASSALYEKVNSGVVAATEKLVDSLRNVGQLLAASGDYRAALKFYAEAIKFSKKRTGRVTRREVKMTIEMAEIMMRLRQMRPRARRLLNAILPHAIALETIELEENALALMEIIDADVLHEAKWKTFIHRLSEQARKSIRKVRKEETAEEAALESDLAEAGIPVEESGKKGKKKRKEKEGQ